MIPEEILVENEEHCIRIPMWGTSAPNLSNSVSVVLYEAPRRHGFEKMALTGAASSELESLEYRKAADTAVYCAGAAFFYGGTDLIPWGVPLQILFWGGLRFGKHKTFFDGRNHVLLYEKVQEA